MDTDTDTIMIRICMLIMDMFLFLPLNVETHYRCRHVAGAYRYICTDTKACHWNRVAEIAESHKIADSLTKISRIASFQEVLTNTNYTPRFMIFYGQTIRMRR